MKIDLNFILCIQILRLNPYLSSLIPPFRKNGSSIFSILLLERSKVFNDLMFEMATNGTLPIKLSERFNSDNIGTCVEKQNK